MTRFLAGVVALLSLVVSGGALLDVDFTKGVPAGGRIGPNATLTPQGLAVVNPTNAMRAAGFRLDKAIPLPKAFTLDATFIADTNVSSHLVTSHLYDDMYVNYEPKTDHQGIQVLMRRYQDSWAPDLHLGFGDTILVVPGPSVFVKPGETAHVTICSYGNGLVSLRLNDEEEVVDIPARPIVQNPNRPVVLGDRGTALQWPLQGILQRVTLTEAPFHPLAIHIVSKRLAFVRGEEGAKLELRVSNVTDDDLQNVRVSVVQRDTQGAVVAESSIPLFALAKHSDKVVSVPLETRLIPGRTETTVTITGFTSEGLEQKASRTLPIGIGPQESAGYPLVMWHYNNATTADVKAFGFTHATAPGLGGYKPVATNNLGKAPDKRLDDALVDGVKLIRPAAFQYPGDQSKDAYVRKTRKGETKAPWFKDVKPEVSNPAFPALASVYESAIAAIYAGHPAFAGVLPYSELRDHNFSSFNTEHLRYKAETGRDVPSEVGGFSPKLSLEKAEKRFPKGVVPNDDPLLAYYRWFWHGGVGWPAMISSVADAYRKYPMTPGFFSFWDPAVRCLPIWGSGGDVDMISQWVYAIPEPMTVAGPVEELFAMAAGRPGQKVGIMTQLICYRSQMAPQNVKLENTPEWALKFPDARFPSIPPDTLQEATWSMIAKPVKAIMYHGWGTVFDTDEKSSYCYTNPESGKRLKALLTELIAPLSPMLEKLGRETPRVAILESFTAQVFGSASMTGWKVPTITFLQRARLDPRVVYEETLERDGFKDIDVLYVPQCRFLTEKMIAMLQDYQQKGGLLIGDEELVPSLKPDILVPIVSFDRPPLDDHTEAVDANEASRVGDAKTRAGTQKAKEILVSAANQLRQDLASRYVPAVDSSSPEIPVYSRQWKDARYVFAINDYRTFGDYVGPWGLTMEKGLPYAGEVTVADPEEKIAAVYELSRGGEVGFVRKDGKVCVNVQYQTNDGRLFLFLKERIARVDVVSSDVVEPNGRVNVTFTVFNEAQKPVQALLPVEINLYDASGRKLDGAGYEVAEGGVCKLSILTNKNDAQGDYVLVCRDRASGLSVSRIIHR